MARILVAEDETAVRAFVTRALASGGHEIVEARDGGEALELIAGADKAKTPFDLLLTDIVMPRMDGIALALKVTKDFPAIRILMMTGYAKEKERAHNLDVLIHDVVAKPFTLDQILAAVDAALGAAASDARPQR